MCSLAVPNAGEPFRARGGINLQSVVVNTPVSYMVDEHPLQGETRRTTHPASSQLRHSAAIQSRIEHRPMYLKRSKTALRGRPQAKDRQAQLKQEGTHKRSRKRAKRNLNAPDFEHIYK